VDLYIHSPIRLHGVVLNSLSTGTTLPLPYSNPISYQIKEDEMGGACNEQGRNEVHIKSVLENLKTR
jgi:hypothetical protein